MWNHVEPLELGSSAFPCLGHTWRRMGSISAISSRESERASVDTHFRRERFHFSPPARWGLLDFMSVACSSPPLLSSSSCSTATLDAQCSLSDLNHDHPRPVFPAGPQPRPSPPSVPCRTSTTTIHAQCSLPDLNREYPRQVFPAGPHVGRYGTKNVQKKVRKNVRQVCYILLANSRVCGRVTGAMPLLTLQVAKFEAISLNRWQSHWGGQRHFHCLLVSCSQFAQQAFGLEDKRARDETTLAA